MVDYSVSKPENYNLIQIDIHLPLLNYIIVYDIDK